MYKSTRPSRQGFFTLSVPSWDYSFMAFKHFCSLRIWVWHKGWLFKPFKLSTIIPYILYMGWVNKRARVLYFHCTIYIELQTRRCLLLCSGLFLILNLYSYVYPYPSQATPLSSGQPFPYDVPRSTFFLLRRLKHTPNHVQYKRPATM